MLQMYRLYLYTPKRRVARPSRMLALSHHTDQVAVSDNVCTGKVEPFPDMHGTRYANVA